MNPTETAQFTDLVQCRGALISQKSTEGATKMASNTTNHKEETNVKNEEKTQENNKQTMLAVKGRLTLKNKPVDLEVGVDLLEYHRANAEALHRLSTEDEKPTLRDCRRKDHIGEDYTHQNKYWRQALGHIVHAAAHRAITSNRGPWMLVEPFTRYTAGYQKEEKPERKVLSVPDESDLVYQTGVALATYNGTPVECSFWLDRDGDANVRLYVNTEQKGLLDEMLDSLEDAAYDFLQGKVLDGHFGLISREGTSSEDVILEPSVMEALQRHVIDYRQHMETIKAAGEDPSRGIIMSGPPGCGKTSANRLVLSALPQVTVVVVSSTSLQRDGLRTIWNLVKRTNGLLILEDLDAVGGVSREIADHPILGQLLELLDGLEGSGCVQVIATTNHLSKLDSALTARPGRFDRIINVGVPTAEARRELLRRSLTRFSKGCSLNLDKAVSRTEGFTGAYVTELGKSAFIESLHDNSETITAKHLNAALQDVLEQFGRASNGHRPNYDAHGGSAYGGVA